MEVLSLNIWAGGAGEKWRCVGASNQQRQVGTHPKQQHGGVVTILIFLITRWAPIQSNNMEGSSPSQSSSSPGGHPSKATTWRGRHHLNLPHHQVGTHPKQQHGG